MSGGPNSFFKARTESLSNSRQSLYSEDIPALVPTMQQHHPLLYNITRTRQGQQTEMSADHSPLQGRNSYIYEVRVDARLGTLFDAHLNSFRSESTSEPLTYSFFPAQT